MNHGRLVYALILCGWAFVLGGALFAMLAAVMPADDWAVVALPFLVAGAGLAVGLGLMGFAANLRLIAALVTRVEEDRPRQITTRSPE